MPRKIARTWRFDVDLRMAQLSTQEEVRELFKEILIAANERVQISGLEQSAFSYDLPDDGIAKISACIGPARLQ